MPKKTLEALAGQPLEGLRALVRVDFNVPVKHGAVTDRTRIDAALPTIAWLRDRGCRVILLSHFGRPKGGPDPAYSLAVVKPTLEAVLGTPVQFLEDPTSEATAAATRRMPRGAVALAENTRFFPGEERNERALAERFAALGDFYVNDAFGSAHRAHASTEAVAHLLKPAVAGLLMAKELAYLGDALATPTRPFVAVLGGAKVSGKIDVIEHLLPRVDAVLVGGAMACTFFAALGLEVGASLIEPDRVEVARDLLGRAGRKLVLPTGAVVAQRLASDAPTREVAREDVEPGWAVYDIDRGTADAFRDRIVAARTVVWNGPMGVFETPPFDRGTIAVARALAEATIQGAVTVVGGGDSAAALAGAGLFESVSHVSTGGGASLEFLEGKTLPGVAALDDL
jgi:phosphoglycerate kinase